MTNSKVSWNILITEEKFGEAISRPRKITVKFLRVDAAEKYKKYRVYSYIEGEGIKKFLEKGEILLESVPFLIRINLSISYLEITRFRVFNWSESKSGKYFWIIIGKNCIWTRSSKYEIEKKNLNKEKKEKWRVMSEKKVTTVEWYRWLELIHSSVNAILSCVSEIRKSTACFSCKYFYFDDTHLSSFRFVYYI